MFSLFIAVEGYQAMFDIKLIKGKNDLKKKKINGKKSHPNIPGNEQEN